MHIFTVLVLQSSNIWCKMHFNCSSSSHFTLIFWNTSWSVKTVDSIFDIKSLQTPLHLYAVDADFYVFLKHLFSDIKNPPDEFRSTSVYLTLWRWRAIFIVPPDHSDITSSPRHSQADCNRANTTNQRLLSADSSLHISRSLADILWEYPAAPPKTLHSSCALGKAL